MVERRASLHHAIILPALCLWGDGSEFHANTVDISAEGTRMRSATIPSATTQLGCSVRGIEVMEIRIVRAGPADFAVRAMDRGATPREVGRKLVEMARLQASLPEAVRIAVGLRPTVGWCTSCWRTRDKHPRTDPEPSCLGRGAATGHFVGNR